jgi:peptidyl-prolyl cis-trans isomerase C
VFAGCSLNRQPAHQSPQEPLDTSPIIVKINGVPEHLSSFERFVKARLSDFYPQSLENQTEKDKLRSGLFDAFVLRQLVVNEAKKSGMNASDDEIGRVIEDQRQQTRGESNDSQHATLESAERRSEITSDLITMKYYRKQVLKDVVVTPEEIQNNFNENAAKYQQANGFYVREIRLDNEDAARQVVQDALRKPDDFATLARQHSNAPSASNGGLMFYATQQLPLVLEQAISPLKVGSISKVVHSNYGFHIFRLEARAEPLPLEKVKSQIEEEILRTKNQALIDAYNERAISSARIRIFFDRLGFNYNGNLKSTETEG